LDFPVASIPVKGIEESEKPEDGKSGSRNRGTTGQFPINCSGNETLPGKAKDNKRI